MTPSPQEVVHLGRYEENRQIQYLLLVKRDEDRFDWFERASSGNRIETAVTGTTVAEAIQKANRHWRSLSFRTVLCGFLYQLPERDEHGQPALFSEMVQSYSSFNGVFFSQERGYNCFIDFASKEALTFWKELQEV